MTDLISREAAIARIKQEMLERNTPFTEREIGFWRGMLFCAEALTNMPSAVTVTGSPTLTITYTERDALDDMDDDDLQWWLENKD